MVTAMVTGNMVMATVIENSINFLYNVIEMKELKKSKYESPSTKRTQVEPEEGMCVVASGEKATIEQTTTIEVEDYKEIDNEISFD